MHVDIDGIDALEHRQRGGLACADERAGRRERAADAPADRRADRRIAQVDPRGFERRAILRHRRPRDPCRGERVGIRSEEPTSELQSLMRSLYAVFSLNKNKVATRHQVLKTQTQTILY